MKGRWQPLWRLCFSLSCTLLTTTLIPVGRARPLLQQLEQQEQELEQRRTQEVQHGFEEINARCDRFYNSFYRRGYIGLSALQVDQLFRLFLPFILLGYILIKSENGTQEICLSLYPTHLTRALLFFSLYYLFNSKYILLRWGKLSCIKGAKIFFII